MRSMAPNSTALPVSPTIMASAAPAIAAPVRSDWDTLKRLFPYLWDYKWRVLAALTFMLCAKLGNVGQNL